MSDWDYSRPWYHGSQRELARLRAGSSVSQNPDVARAFSHRPSLVTTEGERVRHNGTTPGYLYVVDEEVKPEDVSPHPHPVNVSKSEWLVTRELAVRLVERTTPWPEDRLSDEEVADLRRRQAEVGQEVLCRMAGRRGEVTRSARCRARAVACSIGTLRPLARQWDDAALGPRQVRPPGPAAPAGAGAGSARADAARAARPAAG